MMKNLSRRQFVKQTVITAAGTTLFVGTGSSVWANAHGANDDIRVGIVGFHGHGKTHIRNYQRIKGVRIVALCDPDRVVLHERSDELGKENIKVDTYTDIRKLLEDKSIDAISGATPNHWHALSTIWACQAGKHVCVEKPVSHNIFEGRKMVEAARKYKRLVQADLDRRSNEGLAQAIEAIHNQELGKVLVVHSWVYKRRKSMGKVQGAGQVPSSVDYDLWCGPSPYGDLKRKRFHYDWHWQWETGCGEIGNNGPHHLDVCRWALNQQGLAPRVMSIGGRFGYDDDGETPNTQIAFFDYKPAPILFEVRGLGRKSGDNLMDSYHTHTRQGVHLQSSNHSGGTNNGVIVVCEHGTVNLKTLIAHDNKGKVIKAFKGSFLEPQDHFIKALRSGKMEDLRTDILEGHLSTSLCHMGNISHRVGKDASVEEIEAVVKNDPEAHDAYERMTEHLAANGVNLKKTPATLGPWLKMNSKKERFAGPFADRANKLLSRHYRPPYVVHEKV